ncbi:hypothetical protein (DUF2236) [Parafrankia irregularis]|uniref:ER-bound oxygenase mpaB/mpaB'/Rubber oxygenase catalytic domain-containing protein n=1 Tax=Parafrankia irregularis TaxID=795642 RepID=A0A0S4QSL3_9ACTN|nr:MULTISPECIES: oxygenase MpaB family protein [Parafrankia]MBE3199921.1 DUF2236 domain-containing protein [Parafrankia sp. CH37]CUU58078.1 hypothetical protein (DUF2236) [Parafrankia irregularis]
MSNLHRRGVLTLGAALGLVGVADVLPAWSAVGGATSSGTPANWVWDPEIDQIMANVFDNGQVAAVNTAIRPWVDNNDPLPTGLPAPLATWLQNHNKLPAWADMTKLKRAADFNRRKDTYLFMLYGLGSGIMSTVIPREAKSVYWSKGGADMKDRAAKTFTFGYDLSQLAAFEPSGQFIVTANKTRLVHATVRHILPTLPNWLAVADEPNKIPISNADILVTFHSLGTFVHSKLKEWKVPMSAADEEAFLHSWQVAISLLGVRDEYIPATWNDAHAQAAQVLTPILTHTFEGQELAEVLLGLVSEVDLGLTRGFLNEFTRYVLGDQIANWLSLPRDYISAGIIKIGWPSYIAFREGLLPLMPANFYLFDQLIRAIAMAFLNGGTSTQTTPIEIPDMNRPTS